MAESVRERAFLCANNVWRLDGGIQWPVDFVVFEHHLFAAVLSVPLISAERFGEWSKGGQQS